MSILQWDIITLVSLAVFIAALTQITG